MVLNVNYYCFLNAFLFLKFNFHWKVAISLLSERTWFLTIWKILLASSYTYRDLELFCFTKLSEKSVIHKIYEQNRSMIRCHAFELTINYFRGKMTMLVTIIRPLLTHLFTPSTFEKKICKNNDPCYFRIKIDILKPHGVFVISFF